MVVFRTYVFFFYSVNVRKKRNFSCSVFDKAVLGRNYNTLYIPVLLFWCPIVSNVRCAFIKHIHTHTHICISMYWNFRLDRLWFLFGGCCFFCFLFCGKNGNFDRTIKCTHKRLAGGSFQKNRINIMTFILRRRFGNIFLFRTTPKPPPPPS